MLLRQRVKTITHVVELLNFVQNRIRVHEICDFPETLREERTSDAFTYVGETQKGLAVCLHIRNLMNPNRASLSVHRVFALTAPAGVSPAPATEQKYHQENN
jgi:hypothetical protein